MEKKEAEKKLLEMSGMEKDEINKIINNFFTKEDLAEKLFKTKPYFYDDSKIWWLWDNKDYRWMLVDETDILIMIKNSSTANTIAAKEKSEILEAMRQYGREHIPKPIKPTWIQFKDKIFDIETGEELKASSEFFVTNPIPWELHKEKYIETPKMDEIFEEWVGKDHVRTLYEILAYCLIPDYPIHRIFCFIGRGMNGKSKYLELLRKFIGEENCCSTELDTLMESRFEITRLHKKLVCQMGETNFNEMNKTSKLKKLTGGDLIGFEYKNKNPFEEKNYAKILIATNNLPTTTDKTIGFYRRWMIIDFPNLFSEKKDILKDIPEEEYEILAVKCCNILKDLLDKREFHKEGTIEERIKNYEEKSNPFDKFYSEMVEEDFNERITKSEFKKKIDAWCKENRFRELSDDSIMKFMKNKNIDSGKFYMDWWCDDKLIKKQVRGWLGIRWK